MLCVLDGLSFPGSHPASYAGTKPARTASSKEDKNVMWKYSWVHTDRTKPSKHCASNHGVQTVTGAVPAREEAVFLAQPLTSYLISRASGEAHGEEGFPSAGIALGIALASTLQRGQVQRSLETRCVGPSTRLCFPTDPLQDLICLWLRAWPSAN